jgi:hypothetical protein
MLTRLAILIVFGISLVIITPAHADVESISLGKSFYIDEEKIEFVGTEGDGYQQVSVVIKRGGTTVMMLGDPASDEDGSFATIPRPVDDIFTSSGAYEAIAFTSTQKVADGMILNLEYDGERVTEVADFVLALKSIPDYSTDIEKTITFTAKITDDSIEDVVFSLDDAPSGATIDPKSGKFVWTPSRSQGNIQDVHYTFDIIATKGAQEDKESITITVKQAYVEPVKEPIKEPVKEPEPTTTPTEPEELGIASFVDEAKDPQSYVDRYNNEAAYKEWFDENYAEYDSIYQAVGLEEPKVLASFVDPNLDPQYYVDRYNKETTYKEWFDETYPDITIYEAVGLEEEEIVEQEYGECGEGTDLVDGMCVIVDNANGGGCLIATATYGSEMAPQVQFLREIRDNQLMSTNSGSSFMTGFNQLYYLFSPTIADMERENPAFKEAVKIGITPLLSSLSIMSHAESESEILGYGIGVLLLNLGMYVAAPAMLIYKARKYVRI